MADPTTGTLTEVALKPAEVAAAQTDPVVFPTPDTTKSPAGPNWIQIGTEGGFLPAPVVVPAQPTTWITDPTRFDVGNVDQHSLLLAPAERADVIVDFSQYRGKTLILYNDAPAAFPARVPGYDYYTGGPDLTPAGAPTTLPGYGPNTRTIMQVKVSNAAPALAFDRPNTTADRMGALVAAFAHHKPTAPACSSPVRTRSSSGRPPTTRPTAPTSWAAAGATARPTRRAKCDGYARIDEQGRRPIFKFDTLGPQGRNRPQLEIPFQPKGIHDEMNSASFDEWGRMTANMGLEAPGATPLLQNIILYPFVNPATEILDSTGLPSSLDVTPISSAADGTQIWKITHNGVDTHPLHFHLYDVQVINRVTWDNIIIPPEPTELGWKDTVRVSPLEDTIVAVRPIVPTLPVRRPGQQAAAQPDDAHRRQGVAERPQRDRGRVQQHRRERQPDRADRQRGRQLRLGVRVALPHPQPRRDGHDAAGHGPRGPERCRTRRCSPTPGNGGSTSSGPTAPRPSLTDPTTWGNAANEVGYRIERAPVAANGKVGAYA